MVKCCVNHCKNTKTKSKNIVTFHGFPNDERLRRDWMAAVNMSDPTLAAHSLICSDHFLPTCYSAKRKRLKPTALPTEKLQLLQVCRVCLATDTRMQDMQRQGTDTLYSVLLLPQTPPEVSLPSTACYECAARLRNMKIFAFKAQRANTLLLQLLNTDGESLETGIRKIDRDEQGLTTSLKCNFTESVHLNLNFCDHDCKTERGEIDYVAANERHKDDAGSKRRHQSESDDLAGHEIKVEEFENVSCIPTDDERVLESLNVEIPGENNNQFEKPIGKSLKRKSKKLKRRAKNSLTDNEGADLNLDSDLHVPASERKPCELRRGNRHKGLEEFATMSVMQEQERLEFFLERGRRSCYLESPHRCTDCFRGFTNLSAYDSHRRKHEPSSGDYECSICHLRMGTGRHLSKHVNMSHRTRFACKKCPYVCANASRARLHAATHSMQSFRCEACNHNFSILRTYNIHMRQKHPAESPCASCGLTYLGRVAMRAHVVRSHTDAKLKSDVAPCPDCAVNFHSEEALKRHLATSVKHSPDAALWSCEVCDESFSDKSNAVKHRSSHRNAREDVTISCEQCGETMASNRAYHAHFRRRHPDKTRTLYPAMRAPCMCELCGKVFQCQTQLQTHSRLHTGERPYTCDACGKTFAELKQRKAHARTHTRERPYACDECGRTFTDYSNMLRHKAVHTEAKPYSCDICGKSFKYRRTVKDHVQYVHFNKPWPKRVRGKRANPPAANST